MRAAKLVLDAKRVDCGFAMEFNSKTSQPIYLY